MSLPLRVFPFIAALSTCSGLHNKCSAQTGRSKVPCSKVTKGNTSLSAHLFDICDLWEQIVALFSNRGFGGESCAADITPGPLPRGPPRGLRQRVLCTVCFIFTTPLTQGERYVGSGQSTTAPGPWAQKTPQCTQCKWRRPRQPFRLRRCAGPK